MDNHFIVCGLGSLGQQCVVALKEFGVEVVGIENTPPKYWEIATLDTLLSLCLEGDCRNTEVLKQAGVETCRAVLLVTSDPHVNVSTALAIRTHNPHARLVIRSAQQNLNQLLANYLGNFTAFEATQLPAATFALAALNTETIGFFQQDNTWFQVVAHTVVKTDTWCLGRRLYKLNSASRKIVRHIPQAGPPPQFTFHAWEPDALIKAGDVLVYMEVTEPAFADSPAQPLAQPRFSSTWQTFRRLRDTCRRPLKTSLSGLWQRLISNQTRRIALVYGGVVSFLLLSGTLLFYFFYPQSSLLSNFFATTVLLLGGYTEVFGLYKGTQVNFPWWLQLIGLFFALSGIALVGVLYALVTEALLESKFQFVIRRPPMPTAGHVVVVGLGRVGQQVAALLHELGQPVAGVALNKDFDHTLLPQIPLVVGQLAEALEKVNFAQARSVVATTDEELLNLEIGLMARAANPACHLVLRTFEHHLSGNLAKLLSHGEVFSAYSVAGEAFAGAAFGENILGVFRLNQRTITIAEYQIQARDSLNGLLLAEVAYGFAVVPVMLRQPGAVARFLPSEDIRLQVGDVIVLLATMDGLRRIEHGQRTIAKPVWNIRIQATVLSNQEACFEAAGLLSRIAAYPLSDAREALENLPLTLRLPLYQYQAYRLVKELQRQQLQVEITPQKNPA